MDAFNDEYPCAYAQPFKFQIALDGYTNVERSKALPEHQTNLKFCHEHIVFIGQIQVRSTLWVRTKSFVVMSFPTRWLPLRRSEWNKFNIGRCFAIVI